MMGFQQGVNSEIFSHGPLGLQLPFCSSLGQAPKNQADKMFN